MSENANSLVTDRLRLEPVESESAHALRLVHHDPEVAFWYDGWKPTLAEAQERANFMGESWRLHGVHKWMRTTA